MESIIRDRFLMERGDEDLCRDCEDDDEIVDNSPAIPSEDYDCSDDGGNDDDD